jgi:hypothetical protein
MRAMLFYCCNIFFLLCSVSDKSLTEVGQKEVVNVEGVICDRLHTDLKYDRDKVSYVSEYGIPGKLCEGEVHIK